MLSDHADSGCASPSAARSPPARTNRMLGVLLYSNPNGQCCGDKVQAEFVMYQVA